MNADSWDANDAVSGGTTGQKPACWAFRIWTGMTARVWFPLLARHHFRVSPSRLPWALSISLISLISSLPAAIQRRRHGPDIAAEQLSPPIFVVGHWRSGTTFLHELLATDQRFLTPTYLECFATDHFLTWGWLLRRLDGFVPARRPMDNVAMGWDRPQEDEFALLATGAPSPYEAILFPNQRSGPLRHLDIEQESAAISQVWQEALITVMKRVANARRRARGPNDPAPFWFLLKSPTHTARIALLRRMFPGAKFIHVVRDPFELVPSSEHLWRRMFDSQGFQRARYDRAELSLASCVNETMRALYRNFDRDIGHLPSGSYAETRYEELVGDPIGEVKRLRQELRLPDGDEAALGRHLEEVGQYRRNRHRLDEAAADAIRQEWAWYFDRFGYPKHRR